MNTQTAANQQQSPRNLTEIILAVAGVIALGTVMTGASLLHSVEVPKYQDPQCASLARAMVNRSHSMLEGKTTHVALEQAYQSCQNDPLAFRNLLR
ncbi:MAG: hypothetical protein WCH60_18040 [Burkholderiales bacterium]